MNLRHRKRTKTNIPKHIEFTEGQKEDENFLILCLEESKNINEKNEGIKQQSINEVNEDRSSSENEKSQKMYAIKSPCKSVDNQNAIDETNKMVVDSFSDSTTSPEIGKPFVGDVEREGIKQPSVSEIHEDNSSSESEKQKKQCLPRKVHVEDLLLLTK